MKRAFVTGGSGFVGGNLIAELVRRAVEVRALARSGASARKVERAGAEAIHGDLDAVDAIRRGMNGADVVFHAGALVKVWGDPAEFHRVNVQGTQNVIDAARAAGVSRLVHVSTEAVLAGGRPIVGADETWPYPKRPAGLYPLTKGQAERRMIEASRDGIEAVAVRPPFIWGKDDTSVLPQLVDAVKRGKWMWLGGGRYLHTTTHVRNVVLGLLLAAERGTNGGVYFVSDGADVVFRDFVTRLLDTQGVDPGTKSIPWSVANAAAGVAEGVWKAFDLGGEPPVVRSALHLMGRECTVVIDKARRELGYEPEVTIDDGLAEMVTG